MSRFAVQIVNDEGNRCWLTPVADTGLRHLGLEWKREIFTTRADAERAISEMPPALVSLLSFKVVDLARHHHTTAQ